MNDAILLIFEAHATSLDNEQHLASGHNDVALSALGWQQAREMAARHADRVIDAIYCSDLQRAYCSGAQIAALHAKKGTHIPLYVDARLRECDYGTLTQAPAKTVNTEKPNRISSPFPAGREFAGESYMQASHRVGAALEDISRRHSPGATVLIIGHRATQYGIESYINQTPLTDSVRQEFKWQPGWTYRLPKRR